MKRLFAAAALLALPACALNRLSVSDYNSEGKDRTLMDADAGECDRRAEHERPNALSDALAVETQYNKAYDACMEAKGYRRR